MSIRTNLHKECRFLVPALLAAAAALGFASSAAGQTIRASVDKATLEAAPFPHWLQDLGYEQNQLYPITISDLGCPFVDVDVSGVSVSLMMDTGTARGLLITTSATGIPRRVKARSQELNADGTYRGESSLISIETISVLGKVFRNVEGSLSDWRLFSSEPFNGTVGLDFFLDRRLTLDYQARRVGITASPLPVNLNHKRYLTVDLIDPPASQGHILYVRARVNGREGIVHLDTGYNVSFIDSAFAEGLARVERPGKFKVFRSGVPVKLGDQSFILNELREDAIRRGTGFDLPVALQLGSDILSRLVVTIDLRSKKLILALAR